MSVPLVFPYSQHQLNFRKGVQYLSLTAGAAALKATFNQVSKGLLIVNEGAADARVSIDGDITATSTVGVLIPAGQSYSNENFCTQDISYIRTGAADTTLRVEVVF